MVTRLKEQPATPGEPGGWQPANTLIQAGLVDEYRLFVQPIILGKGRPIFPAGNDLLAHDLIDEIHLKHQGETS